MISTPARYLLRLDDLCPTVSRERWQKLRALIEEFLIRPILAVVPDNHDPDLQLSPPDATFWEQMRALEGAGAAIGLHGYRHLCLSRGRSLLGLSGSSEFAGVSAQTQRVWIQTGMHILRSHGLNPEIFVAPRHGFDEQTLEALRAEKICLLSDGFARAPFLSGGITWIPQQLWASVNKPSGVWTICVHPNTASDNEIERLRAFLRANRARFSAVDQLLAEFPPSVLPMTERAYACGALERVKVGRALKRIRRFAFRSSSPQ